MLVRGGESLEEDQHIRRTWPVVGNVHEGTDYVDAHASLVLRAEVEIRNAVEVERGARVADFDLNLQGVPCELQIHLAVRAGSIGVDHDIVEGLTNGRYQLVRESSQPFPVTGTQVGCPAQLADRSNSAPR